MKKSKLRRLKDKCWKLMSLYIRRKNADYRGYVKCVTCGQIKHYKEMNCGHLRHGILDYYEKNLAPQCVYCNQYQSGQRDLYYIWAVKTYGQEEVDNLYKLADEAKKGEKYTLEQLEEIAVDLTLKLSELDK